MNTTTAAVDLAKDVFQVAIAGSSSRPTENHRLTRKQFERFFANRRVDHIIMEACGSAHHWARHFSLLGTQVTLLPAQHVRPYVRRNKTDATDARALLLAAQDTDIHPVAIRSVGQQALQALHRTRSQWMRTRTTRINALRGFCREFGLHVPVGSRTGLDAMARALADPQSPLPEMIRPTMGLLIEEIRLLEVRIAQLERQLAEFVRQSPECQLLMSIPGIGLLTSTALMATTGGSVAQVRSARHFSAGFGLTPREHSSGATRHLGRITKRGDTYLRMLLIHGARSVLRSAALTVKRGGELTGIRRWAYALQQRSNHNKAACALANKLARICYAVLRDKTEFGQPVRNLERKLDEQAFALAH